MRFKTGDIIYCPERKLYGEAIQVITKTICGIKTNPVILVQFPESRVSYPFENQSKLERYSIFSDNKMIEFANYCIGEGFTSNATKRDLVMFLNRKQGKS
jgi:hypothetical protein